jgi:hypothetical protein
MAARKNEPPLERLIAAGALTWLLPGLGHIFLGQRRRGLILLIVVAMTFWCGVAVGGVKSTVDPGERKAWFMAQICAGGHTLLAYTWGRAHAERYPNEHAHFVSIDVAVIYTAVAGLLNILIILDVLVVGDPVHARASVQGPSRTRAPL